MLGRDTAGNWCAVVKRCVGEAMGGTKVLNERTRAAHISAAAALAALLLGSCMERRAPRVDSTPSSGARLDNAAKSWGSALLRFDGANPQCAQLAADIEQKLAAVRDPFAAVSPDQSAERLRAFRARISEHTACVPGAAGAWATFFDGGTDPRAWTWFVGFLPNDGALAKHAGNFPDQVDARSGHRTYTGRADQFEAASYFGPHRLQVVSDYDGDGTQEAVVWTAQIGQEIRGSARGVLWSFQKGSVVPYAHAEQWAIAPFEVDANAASETAPLTDVDGDGRIDLLGYGPFFGVFKQGCGVVESFDALGPRLALHALATGGFSERDAVAVQYAKQQCPARPTRILTFAESGVDRRATFANLGCARLWNVPASAIDSERKSACGVTPSASSDCETKHECAAEVLAVFAAWDKLKTPFTLD